MLLESGVTLCRLNQELLPDPGSPMASTTTPLVAFDVIGVVAGVFGIGAGSARGCAVVASGASIIASAGCDAVADCGLRPVSRASAPSTSTATPTAARRPITRGSRRGNLLRRQCLSLPSFLGGSLEFWRFLRLWFGLLRWRCMLRSRGLAIEIGLQRSRFGVAARRLFGILPAALQAFAHPFAHVGLVTHRRTW